VGHKARGIECSNCAGARICHGEEHANSVACAAGATDATAGHTDARGG
jgi:hypothetical protein